MRHVITIIWRVYEVFFVFRDPGNKYLRSHHAFFQHLTIPHPTTYLQSNSRLNKSTIFNYFEQSWKAFSKFSWPKLNSGIYRIISVELFSRLSFYFYTHDLLKCLVFVFFPEQMSNLLKSRHVCLRCRMKQVLFSNELFYNITRKIKRLPTGTERSACFLFELSWFPSWQIAVLVLFWPVSQ